MAKLLINQTKEKGALDNIQKAEFKVFSQFGDDGIIQYLINMIKIGSDEKNFIEIGVEDYTESNTRFLLINNNWSGLVVDGTKEEVTFIKKDEIYWKQDLTAVCSFVTKENINTIINEHIGGRKIGILSIDIDGNDYWVWEAVKVIEACIVVIEYNGTLGIDKSVSIPYKADFSRTEAHYSGLYWGCSLRALIDLGKRKGYLFVGTNSAGNNAYFVKKENLGKVKSVSLVDGFSKPKYKESKNEKGQLTYIGGKDRLKLIKDKVLYDFKQKKNLTVEDLNFLSLDDDVRAK